MEVQDALLAVCTWAFQTAAHNQSTGVDIALCQLWADPELALLHFLQPLCPKLMYKVSYSSLIFFSFPLLQLGAV